MERSYTVRELDALRKVVKRNWLYGAYTLQPGRAHQSRSYDEATMTKAVEERVRTHMIAGHTAEDLIASEESAKPDDNWTETGRDRGGK